MSSSGKQGFFSSVLNTNYGLWNGLSSKIEAAFNMGLDALDSGSFKSETASQHSRTSAETTNDSATTSQEKVYRSSRVTQYVAEAQNYMNTRRRPSKPVRKDRSIYGQPEICEINEKAVRDLSQDSLMTQDSGNSEGSATKQDKADPFLVFRHTESVGIGSESDTCGPSTSVDSSDAESLAGGVGLGRSGSIGSIRSWDSSSSTDSQGDDSSLQAMEFMKAFVEKVFKNSGSITYEEKAKFGEFCQSETGRLWFARYVNTQRVSHKHVPESIFYSLVQYFAIVLFECAEADDFSPAKSLMNMCFTFYNEVTKEGQPTRKQYPYMYLKQQPIWRSLRFWNAAFFDAVQCERAHRNVPTRNEFDSYSPDDITDEKKFQENITFGQLGTFTCNMHAFGLTREFCREFLRKQCIIANLPQEQVQLLKDNVERMYAGNSQAT